MSVHAVQTDAPGVNTFPKAPKANRHMLPSVFAAQKETGWVMVDMHSPGNNHLPQVGAWPKSAIIPACRLELLLASLV